MRCLPVSFLVAMSMMLMGSANAQETNYPATTPTRHQSSALTTHPASVSQPGRASEPTGQPLSASQLNSIAGSISAKPAPKPKEPSFIPDNVIPADLLPKWEPKPVEPLDEFKISPLNEGLKVPIK